MSANEKVEALHAELTAKMAELVTGEGWRRTLETAARFHRYSPTNVLLIMMQAPDATRVAGYRTWQGLGRQVRKGEHGIRILAPCRYKVTDEKSGEDKMIVKGFTTASVFDITQTDGAELDEVRPELLTGDAHGLDQIVTLITSHGFTFARGDCGMANGVTDFGDRSVTVRADIDPAQAVKTAVHELAHVILHAPSDGPSIDRASAEVEAESVAFIVCESLGLVTDTYSLPYVAGWAGGDVAVMQATAERVIRTASDIRSALALEDVEDVAA